MTQYQFSIIASGLDPSADDFEARFYDHRCPDSTVSFQNGRVILDFDRRAPSLAHAIATALEDVSAAGAQVERVEPDPLVSLSEMAVRAGMSRAAMTNYFKGYRQQDFPPPCARVTSASPLWNWADVAAWLWRQGRLDRNAALAAAVVDAANELIAARSVAVRATLEDRERRLQVVMR